MKRLICATVLFFCLLPFTASAYILAGILGGGTTTTTYSYTDNFTYSNGNLPSPWTVPSQSFSGQTAHTPQVVSNSLNSQSSFWSISYYNQTTTNNQYSQIDISAVQSVGSYASGVMVRIQTNSSWDSYRATVYNNSGTITLMLRKIVGGTDSPLSSYSVGSSNTAISALPHTIKLTAVGSTISVYVDGMLTIQGTDATLTNGYPGIWMDPTNGTIAVMDNWAGGSM